MAKHHCRSAPIEYPGATEEFIISERLPARKKKPNRYTPWDGSFALRDGRYAYWDFDSVTKQSFYHVLTIEDAELLACLEYFDQQEEASNRRVGEHSSYISQDYDCSYRADGFDSLSDAESYRQWLRDEDSSTAKPLPLKSEYAVIHSIVQQLPPKERRVFGLLYDSYLSEAEIKKLLQLTHSAWANEKTRFHEKVHRIFTALGYDVPKTAPDHTDNKDANYSDTLAEIEAKAEEAAELRELGRSIARELSEKESLKKR